MAEPRRTVVADINVVGMGIDRDGGTVRNVFAVFSRQELAPINQHALTARTVGCNPPISGARDKALVNVKN